MRKNQTIFRAVIRANLYAQQAGREHYMCLSLGRAEAWGIISAEERDRAEAAIKKYMQALAPDVNVLRLALMRVGIDSGGYNMWTGGAGRDFYWNWDKRPRKTNNE